MQAALDQLWPFTHELFEADGLTERLAHAGVAVDPASLQPEWDDHIGSTLTGATLARPEVDWRPGGGRQGHHSEHLGYLLAEMQHLHRSHPGARW
jgi:ring-1,2-phenylacetyl-CoA epoxidase subunit PaaC